MNNCSILQCTKCDISNVRKNIVNGEGNLNKRSIMFIGEAPGYYEDKQGIPFVGNSGKLLNLMLDLIGLGRKDIYVTNVIKCRPLRNRSPLAVEIANCKSNLECELNELNPKIVVLLGNVALNSYFNKTNLKISSFIGYYVIVNNRLIIATYHPSYVLRNIKSKTILLKYVNSFRLILKMYRLLINPLVTSKI